MKILFCGSVLPEDAETRLQYLSNAGNRFQLNFINTLRRLGHDVLLCSYIGFPTEQDYIEKFRNRYEETETGCFRGNGDRYVFKSVLGLKAIPAYKKTYCSVIKETHPDVCVCYNAIYAWFGITGILRKNGIKSVLILADYTGTDGVRFDSRYTLNIIKSRLELNCIRSFVKVVGLSSYVKRYLKADTEFLHIEGGIDSSKWRDFPKPDREASVRRFMYSGLFSDGAGVDTAVRAFQKIRDDNVQLIITGNGDLEDLIREEAKNDRRIRFYGRLDYDEYVQLLAESHILLNPRNMDLPENKNNFPSKMLEYLATGRVIVSTRFAGWEKFAEHAIFSEGSDAGSFANEMRRALEQYDEVADETYFQNRILANEYDWTVQAERIIR